jgi:hypothetical protein
MYNLDDYEIVEDIDDAGDDLGDIGNGPRAGRATVPKPECS